MTCSTRIAGVLLLASCETKPASEDDVNVWCHGPDRIYTMNDGSYGSGLFVVPDHRDCQP